jgi:hypothetical protein
LTASEGSNWLNGKKNRCKITGARDLITIDAKRAQSQLPLKEGQVPIAGKIQTAGKQMAEEEKWSMVTPRNAEMCSRMKINKSLLILQY